MKNTNKFVFSAIFCEFDCCRHQSCTSICDLTGYYIHTSSIIDRHASNHAIDGVLNRLAEHQARRQAGPRILDILMIYCSHLRVQYKRHFQAVQCHCNAYNAIKARSHWVYCIPTNQPKNNWRTNLRVCLYVVWVLKREIDRQNCRWIKSTGRIKNPCKWIIISINLSAWNTRACIIICPLYPILLEPLRAKTMAIFQYIDLLFGLCKGVTW